MFSQNEREGVHADIHAEETRPSTSAGAYLGRARSIPADDLVIEPGHIASGSFGTVYRAEWRGLQVAVKFLRRNENGQDFTEEQKRKLEEEVNIVSNKPHRHIVQVYGFCRERNCIVMDYFSNGSVEDMIHRNDRKQAEASNILWRLQTAESVASGMDSLHQPPTVIHRDLKASNVFVSLYNVARVGDFGQAKHLVELQDTSTGEERRERYGLMMINHAPEVIDAYFRSSHSAFSKSSDVFSFGLFLKELLDFQRPYNVAGYNSREVWPRVLAVRSGSLMPEVDEERARSISQWYPCAEPIFDVFRDCVKFHPEERPDFHEIHIRIKKIREDVEAAIHQEEANASKPDPKARCLIFTKSGYILVLLIGFIIYAFSDFCALYKGEVTWLTSIINLVAALVLVLALYHLPRFIWAWLRKCPNECFEALIAPIAFYRRNQPHDGTVYSLQSELKAAPPPKNWPVLRAALLTDLNPNSKDNHVMAVLQFCQEHTEDVLTDEDWMILKNSAFRSTAVMRTNAWTQFEETSGIHINALNSLPPSHLFSGGPSTPFNNTMICNSWLNGSDHIFGDQNGDIEGGDQSGLNVGRSETSFCPPSTPDGEGSRHARSETTLFEIHTTQDERSRHGRSEPSTHGPKISINEGSSGV